MTLHEVSGFSPHTFILSYPKAIENILHVFIYLFVFNIRAF